MAQQIVKDYRRFTSKWNKSPAKSELNKLVSYNPKNWDKIVDLFNEILENEIHFADAPKYETIIQAFVDKYDR